MVTLSPASQVFVCAFVARVSGMQTTSGERELADPSRLLAERADWMAVPAF